MDARWLPILAAALGVLGGVLGALAGGWIANEGQESQFKSERAAEIQNFRIEAYGNFAGTAEALALTLATDPSEAATETNASEAETETACEPPTTDGTAPVDQESAFREVLVTKARLLLWVEREEVATAAVEATNTLNKVDSRVD
jgi:hypothetical protein